MAHILIAFASMSGNTEDIADLLKSHLTKYHEVTIEEIEDISPSDLSDYDAVLLGSYTWNDGDLPYEVEDFYEELEEVELNGVPASVFGSGDRMYPMFCEAVHTLEKQLKESGAVLVSEGLTVEMNPDTSADIEGCRILAQEVARQVSVLR
ncbi:flavodoxin [Salimicrobium flavidum]|uniref:Flavodoxin n=1 Tax=Salimicrobium flavidum TaxID=570947 RepID=A0A1N7J713_9BACI|nr:flavodoxin [Salimicrobium flavidum]SIS45026.1 flavodoxin I [Salimicrobium flavidum]